MTDAKDFIEGLEGRKLVVYTDGAGFPTVGVGHKVVPEDKLELGDTITEEQADAFLDHDIEIASNALNSFVTTGITNNISISLVSLGFNIGMGSLRNSTLISMLNHGYMQGAADQFLRWDKIHVNGELVESQGLLNRRKAERELFLTPDDDND